MPTSSGGISGQVMSSIKDNFWLSTVAPLAVIAYGIRILRSLCLPSKKVSLPSSRLRS